MFGYMNENQVAIGESSIGNQRKMSNSTPSAGFDLTMLTLVAMERSRTAREAIQVMGSLAETYGYGFHDEGEMLAVSDPNEAWIFEIMPVGPLWTPKSGKPGAVWCAERVPDDEVSVCPNESRIGEIDLANKDFFMASPNVVSYAVESGLLRPEGRQALQLEAGLFSARGQRHQQQRPVPAALAVLRPRRPVPQVPAGDAEHGPPLLGQARPEDLGPGRHEPDPRPELRHALRPRPRHPRRTLQEPELLPADPGHRPRPGRVHDRHPVPRVACPTRSAASSGSPSAPRTRTATCRSTPGATELPKSFAVGDHWAFNREAARWAFDYVDFHVQVAYDEAIKDVKTAQDKYEAGVIARIPEIDAQALALYKKKPGKAAEFLTAFGLNNAKTVVDAWWKLGDDLLVKYNRLYVYDAGKRDFHRGQPAPPTGGRRPPASSTS